MGSGCGVDERGWASGTEHQRRRRAKGGPGAARGEKLEKGRFKYQAPRGGPLSRSLHPAVTRRFSLFPPSFVSFASPLLLFSPAFLPPPPPPSTPHYHPPPFAVLRLCTYTPVPRTYIHRHVHTSIDPRPEKRRLRAVRRRRTLLRQCYVLIGRPLPTLLSFLDPTPTSSI